MSFRGSPPVPQLQPRSHWLLAAAETCTARPAVRRLRADVVQRMSFRGSPPVHSAPASQPLASSCSRNLHCPPCSKSTASECRSAHVVPGLTTCALSSSLAATGFWLPQKPALPALQYVDFDFPQQSPLPCRVPGECRSAHVVPRFAACALSSSFTATPVASCQIKKPVLPALQYVDCALQPSS
ncbi:uncharacterized protein [Dermacentor andersoni]|uniref:uncharacterized protein isoform X2 n=1 Tax=Dermacentor andersoni TaxID=34620 RepID=UPI002416995F|nr:uncharacterized protein LOC126521270 isoform X2 [Dermacentor andersoni]